MAGDALGARPQLAAGGLTSSASVRAAPQGSLHPGLAERCVSPSFLTTEPKTLAQAYCEQSNVI